MEVWYFWAKKKHRPTSSNSCRHRAGLWWMFTPRASRQSAVPHWEEAARLPCLATFPPPAAVTRAAVLEMLKLWALSPPVPTDLDEVHPRVHPGRGLHGGGAAMISSMVCPGRLG